MVRNNFPSGRRRPRAAVEICREALAEAVALPMSGSLDVIVRMGCIGRGCSIALARSTRRPQTLDEHARVMVVVLTGHAEAMTALAEALGNIALRVTRIEVIRMRIRRGNFAQHSIRTAGPVPRLASRRRVQYDPAAAL